MKRTLLVTSLVLASWLAPASSAPACPNCKEAVAAQPGSDAARMREGYFYSILVMMAMPFTLLGTGAFFVVRAVRRGTLPPL